MFDFDKAIAKRSQVRIIKDGGRPSLLGVVCILMGYNAQYHTFKVGFIDSDGKYTGEKTVVSFNSIELVEAKEEETNNVKISEGPLTDRQTRIIKHVLDGERHKEIANALGVSISIVRQEVTTITHKMREQTSAAAMAKYAEATAYRRAAIHLRDGRIPNPLGEAEEHVNHVLDGIADLFQDWADQRMPK